MKQVIGNNPAGIVFAAVSQNNSSAIEELVNLGVISGPGDQKLSEASVNDTAYFDLIQTAEYLVAEISDNRLHVGEDSDYSIFNPYQ